MNRSTRQRIVRSLGTAAAVLALSGTVLGQTPTDPGPPFGRIDATLQTILDRLAEVEAKIDAQSTDLRGVTQNWDKKLDSTNGDTAPGREGCDSDRFTCVLGDTAVRDNETGLVWDRAPDNTSGQNGDGTLRWSGAVGLCLAREAGGRTGFHLPLQEQLASLVDRGSNLCLAGGPCLPDGHPFLTVRNATYWSATSKTDAPVLAHRVDLSTGSLGAASNKMVFAFNWWCVRGGQTFDGNTHDSLH